MPGMDAYDAIMLLSYGGPNGEEDVLPFMRNATRGRGIPDERLLQVAAHYKLSLIHIFAVSAALSVLAAVLV